MSNIKKPQLFLLHFAGGNCYSFQFMIPLLREFDVIPIELPGRGKRSGESLLRNFNTAAKDVFEQICIRLTTGRFLIYGHSMGAYLGLEAAHMLEKEGRSPAYLIVSGNAGPGTGDDRYIHLMDHENFIAELERLGGVPREVLENDELLAFFDPILRADFEIAEKNGIERGSAIDAPLYAMMGSQEEKKDRICNWANFTRAEFTSEILDGDHFFIQRHSHRIAAIFKECYNKRK